MDEERLVKTITKYRNYRFIQVLRQTMLILFPVILIGAFSWTLSNCIFNSDSLVGRLINLNKWFPQSWFLRTILNDIYTVTTGFLTLYATAISADITTKLYNHRNLYAPIFAAVSYLLIFHHSIRGNQQVIEMQYYTAFWFIIGVLFGYAVGLIFAKFGSKKDLRKHVRRYDLLDAIRENSKAMAITLLIALFLHVVFAGIRTANLDTRAYQAITSFFNQHSNYWLAMLMALITTLTGWLGFPGSLIFNNAVFNNESLINLNHVLQNKSYVNLPYPFTPSGFFNAFAAIGGVGCTLALIISILIVSHSRGEQRIVMWSTLPAIFNANLPLMLGIPIIFNPIFIIPVIVTPLLNMFLGSVTIGLGLLPPLVYPVPAGTSGILTPLVASGGNWVGILTTIVLLVIDVLVYIPFVKIAERVEWQVLLESEQEHE